MNDSSDPSGGGDRRNPGPGQGYISPDQVSKAQEAIRYLSTLPCRNSPAPSTSGSAVSVENDKPGKLVGISFFSKCN